MPNREEFELSRVTVGFFVTCGLPHGVLPDGLGAPSHVAPLTISKSTFSRPYSVTFAVCACAASGAARTPATATATSFFFIESLLYRKNLARKPPFARAIRTLLNSFEKLRPIVPNAGKHWQGKATEASKALPRCCAEATRA